MTPPVLILTPCGGAKRATPAPAAELYTGAYTRACLAVARRLAAALGADDRAVRILSAGYGLLPLGPEPVAPYDVTFGDAAAIATPALRAQAEAAGLLAVPRVWAFGGARYVERARALWPHVHCPLDALPPGRRGIGYQRAWLAEVLDGRRPIAALFGPAGAPADAPNDGTGQGGRGATHPPGV